MTTDAQIEAAMEIACLIRDSHTESECLRIASCLLQTLVPLRLRSDPYVHRAVQDLFAMLERDHRHDCGTGAAVAALFLMWAAIQVEELEKAR